MTCKFPVVYVFFALYFLNKGLQRSLRCIHIWPVDIFTLCILSKEESI